LRVLGEHLVVDPIALERNAALKSANHKRSSLLVDSSLLFQNVFMLLFLRIFNEPIAHVVQEMLVVFQLIGFFLLQLM
jgi:hypothetical protein